jgi:hypothetical protein
MDQQDYDLVPRTLRLGDDTGRGAEQYAEVIQRAHAAMVDLMRADEAAMAEEEARAAEEAARQAEAKSASAPAGEDEEKKPTPESKEPEKASEQKKKIPRKVCCIFRITSPNQIFPLMCVCFLLICILD